uniref:Protein unc-80 homolog n=1 Tax=Plectus sambesii TaxID=2011161 RepID=A0A914WE92_9BILA
MRVQCLQWSDQTAELTPLLMANKTTEFSRVSSVKSRASSGAGAPSIRTTEDSEQHACVPLPIQSFLWRQTNPFLGPKVGKLHEASCVVRVLMSSLLSAWSSKIFCTGCRRVCPMQLGRCRDGASSKRHSLTSYKCAHIYLRRSITHLFVYLLAPLVHCLTEEDVSNNIRLESGLPIWQALWQCRQPDLLCFSAPVKPRKAQLMFVPLIRRTLDITGTAAQGIYIGDEASTEAASFPLRSPSMVLSSPCQSQPPTSFPPPTSPSTHLQPSVQPARPTFIPPIPLKPQAQARLQKKTESARKDDKDADDREPHKTSIVRSVSEYRRDQDAVNEMRSEMRHKSLAKSNTTSAEIEGAFRLDELEHALKFVEESGSLSESYEFSDRAPLVQLKEICNGESELGDFSPGSECQVICQTCNTVVYRDGTVVGLCKCKRKSSTASQSKYKIVAKKDSSPKDEAQQPLIPPALPEVTVADADGGKSDAKTSEPSSSASRITLITPSTNLPTTSLPATTTTIGTLSPTTTTSKLTPPSSEQPKSSATAAAVSWADSGALDLFADDHSVHKINAFGADAQQASYFDVAVLRCLFIKHWSEEGIFWALKYYYQRLLQIQVLRAQEAANFRNRSSSVPAVPRFKISLDGAMEAADGRTDVEVGLGYRRNPTWAELQLNPSVSSMTFTSSKPTGDSDAARTSLEGPEGAADDQERQGRSSSVLLAKPKVAFVVDGTGTTAENDTQAKRRQSDVRDSLSPQSSNAEHRKLIKQSSSSRLSSGPPNEAIPPRRGSLATLKMLISGSPRLDSKFQRDGTSFPFPKKLSRNRSDPSLETSDIDVDDCLSTGNELSGGLPYISVVGPQSNSRRIARSQTETNVSYGRQYMPEAVGSGSFIEKNGHINLLMVLKAVTTILERQTSLRVCEMALNIGDVLLNMGCLDPLKFPIADGSCSTSTSKPAAPVIKKAPDDDYFTLLVEVLFRVYMTLGCPFGCNDGIRTPHGDFLRAQARTMLARLHRSNGLKFGRSIALHVKVTSPQRLLDLVHSFTGFCHPESAPSRPRSGSSPRDGRRPSNSTDDGRKSAPSYRNRFNESHKGVEGALINALFKPLVTKLMVDMSQLLEPENMSLYHDVRSLMAFVQERHGNPFRRVELSAMIDGRKPPAKTVRSDKHPNIGLDTIESKSTDNSEDGSQRASPSGTLAPPMPPARDQQASMRRGLFKRREKSSNAEESDIESSPSTPRNVHGVSSEEAIGSSSSPLLPSNMSKKKSGGGKLQFAFNLLKSVRTDNPNDDDASDPETAPDRHPDDTSSQEGVGSIAGGAFEVERRARGRISFKNAAKTVSLLRQKQSMSFDSNADEMENIYNRRRSLVHLLIPNSKLVNLKGIQEGTRRFAFLLETCRPGSVPDAPLLGAVLDLKSPVLARAAILLECAHFVHRCNKGQWPDWIRSSAPTGRQLSQVGLGALGNRGTPSATRRMHLIQRSAGRMFYQWGEEVGKRLEQLLEADKITAEKLVAMPHSEQRRRQLRISDDLEDFLDEAIVNDETGEKCPLALRLIAVFLLQEITAFMRETFQTIPRTRGQIRPGLHPGWEKLMSHRRWSILSNTFPAQQQQQSGSVQSIADVAAALHPSLTTERRISFSTPDSSPRGSHGTIDEASLPPGDKKGAPTTASSSTKSVRVRPHSYGGKYFQRQTSGATDELSSPGDEVGTVRVKSHRHRGQSHSAAQAVVNAVSSIVPESARRLAQGRQRLLKRGTPGQTSSQQQQQPSLESSLKHRRQTSMRTKKQSRAGQGPPMSGSHPEIDREDTSETVPLMSVEPEIEGKRKRRPSSFRASWTFRTSVMSPLPDVTECQSPEEPLPALSGLQSKRMSIFRFKSFEGNHNQQRKESSKSLRKLSSVGIGAAGDELDAPMLAQAGSTSPLADHAGGPLSPDRSPQPTAVSGQSSAHGSTNHPPPMGGGGAAAHMLPHDDEEEQMFKSMPWLKVTIRLANSFNFVCPHQRYCHPYCFERVLRQCHRLTIGLRKVHMEDLPLEGQFDRRRVLMNSWQEYQDSKRKPSQRASTAVPRRESASVRHGHAAFDKGSTVLKSLLIEKLNEIEEVKERETKLSRKLLTVDEEEDVVSEVLDTNKGAPILGYIRTQMQSIIHAPLSTVLKGAVILNDHQLQDMIPVAWEMLLQSNYHVTSTAAALFIIASVKQPEYAVDIIKRELMVDDATRRTCAIIRFYALWRNRFHCWLKMEDGAQMIFKVPPPGIDFTLPSPPIGQSQLNVVDPPWMPHVKTKVEELSLKEEEDATSQTIMTMTHTRRKQKQELVKRAVHEADERQSELRQQFHFRATPVVQQAAYEPALFHHPLGPQQSTAGAVDADDGANCDCRSHFLEKLTNRERQEELMALLRKLVLRFRPFPSQTAYSLLNYLFGFVMYYVRSPCEGSQDAIAMALSLTWLVAPSVHGLYFKDLKQTLRKEQCDHALMITANVPSAKKILVHGPDSTGIPSQFPIHEDTQFQQLLTDSLEFFNISDDSVDEYFLVDTKTGMLHTLSAYVRDFYFFHRSFYPQLNLVRFDPDQALRRMKEMAFTLKFIDTGKVMLTHSILKNSPEAVIPQRIYFLHDELTKLPAFPRKALEACFGMYGGSLGSELQAMDAMHKFVWVQLMSDLFARMENAFMFGDLHLFINVINGIMIMHCEDSVILRRCMATYLNIAIHFSPLFATNGFFLIMPTVLRCYSQRQTNMMLCRVIEFVCKQFYLLHRKPFVLQMFGSIANILDNNDSDFEIDPMRIKASYLFNLLLSLQDLESTTDQLDIMGLVSCERPAKAIDLCYREDPNTFCILTDALASCVTVCAYAPESRRSYQMLLVTHAILPHYMRRIEQETRDLNNSQTAVKHEMHVLTTLCVEFKALINSCEALARNFSGPQRTFDIVNVSGRGKSFVAESPQFFDPPTIGEENNKVFLTPRDSKKAASTWEAIDDSEVQREMFRKPRDALLALAATFLELTTSRLKEIGKLTGDNAKTPDVMDHKSHVKLSEIALSLLKLAPYDPNTMGCIGLQKYFMNIVPVTDWSVEHNRSALNIVLRRLDKTFTKIGKKGTLRRRTNWSALSNWLKGLYDTLNAFPYIAHLHPLKTMTQMCLRILIGDPSLYSDDASNSSVAQQTSSPTVLHGGTPPAIFCSAVLKLTSFLMQALGQLSFSLEYVCSPDTLGSGADKVEAVLCHILIPLFLRAGTAKKDAPQLRQKDISYCLNLMLNAINPPISKQSLAPVPSANMAASMMRDTSGRQGSVSVTDRGYSATVSTHRIIRESICQAVFLALKVLILSFQKQMTVHWPKVAKIVRDLINKRAGGPSLYTFLDFILAVNSPVTLMIVPLVQQKLMWQKPSSDQEAHWQSEFRERLGQRATSSKCYYTMLMEFSHELHQLKDELTNRPLEVPRSQTPTIHSDSGSTQSIGGHRLSYSRPPSDSRRLSFNAMNKLGRLAPGSFGKGGPSPQDTQMTIDESIIAEDTEGESSQVPSTPKEMQKSPSMPHGSFKSNAGSGRQRSSFGWRSSAKWRRDSKGQSESSMGDSERSVQSLEMHDMMPHRRTKSFSRRKAPSFEEAAQPTTSEEPIARVALVPLNATALSTTTNVSYHIQV